MLCGIIIDRLKKYCPFFIIILKVSKCSNYMYKQQFLFSDLRESTQSDARNSSSHDALLGGDGKYFKSNIYTDRKNKAFSRDFNSCLFQVAV